MGTCDLSQVTIQVLAQISFILCQLFVCSDKSQLRNYANAHCLKISIQTWLMSYHVKTTSCHDVTTYDISWQPYSTAVCIVSFPVQEWPGNETTMYEQQQLQQLQSKVCFAAVSLEQDLAAATSCWYNSHGHYFGQNIHYAYKFGSCLQKSILGNF